jgi:hypothetical protein
MTGSSSLAGARAREGAGLVVGQAIVGGFEETAAADRSGELRRLVATT